MRKSKRPRRTDAPKKYGEVKIIQQPASLIAGTDICIATGKQPVVILHSTFSIATRCFSQPIKTWTLIPTYCFAVPRQDPVDGAA